MFCTLADVSSSQVVSEWMRPTDIVKEKHLDCHPCLFSGVANSSDVCQVVLLFFILFAQSITSCLLFPFACCGGRSKVGC